MQTRGNDLETIVFLELKRRGAKIYYYKTSNGLECDFLVFNEDDSIELIQVSSSLKDERTKQRELRVFSKAIEELSLKNTKHLVICEDNSMSIEKDNLNIEIINILEWLLKI